MKKIFPFLLTITLSYNAWAQETSVSTIKETAQLGYAQYLDKIPVGSEGKYGFKLRTEFAKVSLGKPFEIITLNEDFYASTTISNQDYFISTNEWRIPLMVDHEFRCMLTVANMSGVWKVVGIGAAGLAHELNLFENIQTAQTEFGKLLRVPQMSAEFYIANNSSQKEWKAYPMASANLALNQQNNFSYSYTIAEVLSIIQSQLQHP